MPSSPLLLLPHDAVGSGHRISISPREDKATKDSNSLGLVCCCLCIAADAARGLFLSSGVFCCEHPLEAVSTGNEAPDGNRLGLGLASAPVHQ